VSNFTVDKKARLLDLSKQELGLFTQIRGICEKQAELIDADDITAFLESLDRRQDIIEKIDRLHQESDVLMQSYVSYSNTAGGKSFEELEAVTGQLRDMIAECIGLNDKIMEAAKKMAGDYSERISRLNTNREGLGRYRQGLPNDPKMFDKMT